MDEPQPINCNVDTRYLSLIGGDVVGDKYSLLTNALNYLVVTKWDPEEKILSGEFQAHYLFDGEEHYHDWMADTIHFTEGSFTTRFLDKTE